MKKTYNPLDSIPSPELIRRRLNETETLAAQFRVLLKVSELLHSPVQDAGNLNRLREAIDESDKHGNQLRKMLRTLIRMGADKTKVAGGG